jgi:hypothetical protein
MSNLRTSDGETGDAHFEFGHLIEPDKRELSAEPMPFASNLGGATSAFYRDPGDNGSWDQREAIKYPHRTLTQFIKSYRAGRERLAKLKT